MLIGKAYGNVYVVPKDLFVHHSEKTDIIQQPPPVDDAKAVAQPLFPPIFSVAGAVLVDVLRLTDQRI